MLVGLNGCETQHFLFVTVGTGFPISTQFAAEYPPPKKTEDYVDSVCVAFYGFNWLPRPYLSMACLIPRPARTSIRHLTCSNGN